MGWIGVEIVVLGLGIRYGYLYFEMEFDGLRFNNVRNVIFLIFCKC